MPEPEFTNYDPTRSTNRSGLGPCEAAKRHSVSDLALAAIGWRSALSA